MDERREASFSLAYALAEDPMSFYLVRAGDSAEQAWKSHLRIMSCVFAVYRLAGIVTTVGPDYDAVALWTPPGKFLDGWWTTLRSGTLGLVCQIPVETSRRCFSELGPALHRTRKETMGARNNDTYYLGYIGTKPCARGKGYASALIRAMADKADAEKRPIYLESSSSENNAFYAKFGFELKTLVELKRGPAPVTLYCMVREPQPGTPLPTREGPKA
ncbi:hypothetical protein G6O67_000699 [Ophiocordyceps sinensis]|uniref:N-acetyltransferase domain-containing protein n=1 Tax=Ophiocordyceps sinensis TaxID=72228 RepID=A0A8H4VA99_9HYPO|nr:hypothetical protein G6O67_000699 [Ophiocordyceps sinensis]